MISSNIRKMSVVSFINLFNNENITTIYVHHKVGHKHLFKHDNIVYIDLPSLIKRREFHHKIWLKSHDNYYEIIEYINDSKFAKILAKFTGRSVNTWIQFLYRDLFSLKFQDKSLLVYKIPNMLWEYFRISSFIISRSKR